MAFSKIMVIIDPTRDTQPAFERGLESCHMTGARLHVYVCLNWDRADQARREDTQRVQACIDYCLTTARDEGIESVGELEWAQDWRNKATAAAARCCASIIYKSYPPVDDKLTQIRTNYDWTLLRLAPCPVLLIKNRRGWKHLRVLAALYPDAPDAAHQKLNHQIISFAQRFSDAYGSEAHIVTVYDQQSDGLNSQQLAEICGVAEEFVHVSKGAPAEVIRNMAVDIDADLILLGTVGRDGLQGPLVGNTSTRLVDHAPSDVLILN